VRLFEPRDTDQATGRSSSRSSPGMASRRRRRSPGVKAFPDRNPRFYHLDTALCPLTRGEVMFVPGAFTLDSKAAIRERVPVAQRIEIGLDDACLLAANAISLGNVIVMSGSTQRLQDVLAERGYGVVVTPLPSFRRSGGSAFCLTLRLDRLSRVGTVETPAAAWYPRQAGLSLGQPSLPPNKAQTEKTNSVSGVAGSRLLTDLLAAEGRKIGRRHVKTLMRRMGIEALYRRPRTTKPEPGHKIDPYPLRGVEITRPNQVWAREPGGTMSSSSGCGVASNTRRSISKPMTPLPKRAHRSGVISTSTIPHHNTHLFMSLKRTGFAARDAVS
jgi:hypothetical protein